jgi:polyphosphate kinase
MGTNFRDNMQTWMLRPDGTYDRIHPAAGEAPFSVHEYFMTHPSLSGQSTREESPRVGLLKRFLWKA